MSALILPNTEIQCFIDLLLLSNPFVKKPFVVANVLRLLCAVNVEKALEKIVFWQTKILKIPSGRTRNTFTAEEACLLECLTQESTLEAICMKVVPIMEHLLLQRSHSHSKTKKNVKYLARRMKLWKLGDVLTILKKVLSI